MQEAAGALRAALAPRPDVVHAAVRRDGLALEFAPVDLRADAATVRVAVAQNGDALRFAAPELRADKELVLLAVRSQGRALQHAAKPVRRRET